MWIVSSWSTRVTSPRLTIWLWRALEAQGRQVRLVGQAGGPADCEAFRHGHFYPLLASWWGCRLPHQTVKLVEGACHGFDMLRLVRWLSEFGAAIAHFQWSHGARQSG
jgi:hypothetical protein